jgi:acyl carrier protein
MKTTETTVLKVVQIMVDKLGVDPSLLEYKASFSDDLGADSLDVYELLMAFEKEFKFTINEDEIEKLTTVGSVIEFIDTKLSRPIHHNHRKTKTAQPKETEIILMNHLKGEINTNNFLQMPGY